jgi:4,5-DOPA dioxygenase extradiol
MIQERMPAVFIGHGSPMNTLEDNVHTRAWREFAAGIPVPRAILAISAHWWIPVTAVTVMARPRTIHDFWGFPDELFAVEYPAPGDPALARRVADLLAPREVVLDEEDWGLDHGTWSVLAHLFPAADVPVVQLSIRSDAPMDEHLEIGRSLAPLRDEGVLVMGSGNVVHNLSRIEWSNRTGGTEWARRFDEEATRAMQSDPASVAGLAAHPDWSLAVPTPEHFQPLLYVAGIADATDAKVSTFAQGCTLGSLSMTSYVAA